MKPILQLAVLLAAAIALPGVGTIAGAATASTASAATETDWEIPSNVTRTDGVNYGTESQPRYGTQFEGEGAFTLRSSKKVWMDRFGVSYRIDRNNTAEGIVVAVSSEQDKLYSEAEGSFSLVITPTDTQMTKSTIAVYAGSEQVGTIESDGMYWDDSHTYSTNTVYLAKSDTGWLVNLNDAATALSEEASAKCDAEYAAFESGVGYFQLGNRGGRAKFIFVSVLYGAPASLFQQSTRYENGPIFAEPVWTVTRGDEVAGFTGNNGASFAIQGTDALPFNGFEYTVRAAHGEESTSFFMAFTSLYQSNWYAGTYSICFYVLWDKGAADDSADVRLMRYTPATDSNHEEPIKFSQKAPFRWFESNTFRIIRERGVYKIYLNGTELYAGRTDSSGKTAADYLTEVEPYYESGAGYVQFYCQNPHDGDSFVIERAKIKEVSSNALPAVDRTYAAELSSAEYRVGEPLRIDLSKLIPDADGDTLHFFATKGKIADGIWEYTATKPEDLFVTITGTDGYGSDSIRLMLQFGNGQGVAAPDAGTGETDDGGCAAGISAATGIMFGVVILCAIPLIVKKGEKKK